MIAKRLKRYLRHGIRSNAGFTLIELLVVIIIIAVLAAIAIPTFLGQRQQAEDSAAFSLVRNGLTAMQTAFVDTGDYSDVTAAMLATIEPSIQWVDAGENLVDTNPAPWILATVPAQASENEVAFYAESATTVDLANISASGNLFGMQIDSLSISDTGYVKVKVIEGTAELGW